VGLALTPARTGSERDKQLKFALPAGGKACARLWATQTGGASARGLGKDLFAAEIGPISF
jgi:hypothetical protein